MKNSNNFASNCKQYLLNIRHIKQDIIERFESENLISYNENHIEFVMKDLDGNQVGIQERYIQPIILHTKEVKSKTKAGGKVGYFYEKKLDYSSPIIVTEGEIDRLSIGNLKNVVALQGIGNFKKMVEQLKGKGATTIYLLVDKDDNADIAIGRILDMDSTFLSGVFDSRELFGVYKDINEYTTAGGEITMEMIEVWGKSLGDFKNLSDSLLVKDKIIKIDHNEFAKYVVKKFNIASANRNLFIYDHGLEKGIWKPLDKQQAEKMIMTQLEYLLGHIMSHFKINDMNNTLDFVITHADTEEMKNRLLLPHQNEINLSDGILDAKTMEIRNYKKIDYKFQKLSYPSTIFKTYTPPQKWLNFLDEILEGVLDKDVVIAFLQEFIGWLFITNTKYEKALLVYGSGANGKGVLLSVIKEILGSQNCSNIGLHEINKDQYLYNLLGKLVNVDSDMQQSVQLDSGTIKKLVSGEAISAKSVYKQPIEFVPYARLLIATNELPYLKTIDNSIRRRFIFLHLRQSFYGKENPNLINEILAEKNDIFVRAIEGLKRLLQRDHFSIPEELERELNNFIKENDTIELFIEDGEVERMENAKVYIKRLYNNYRFYCLDNGLRPLSKRTLNRRLEDKGFKKEKDQGGRHFLGLSEVDDRPF